MKLGEMTTLSYSAIFHMVGSVYRLVTIRNSPQFPVEFRNGLLDHDANLLSTIADVCSLQQLITDPTRCTESSSTLFDLIFTNRPDSMIICSGVSHIGISDHSLIYAYRKIHP